MNILINKALIFSAIIFLSGCWNNVSHPLIMGMDEVVNNNSTEGYFGFAKILGKYVPTNTDSVVRKYFPIGEKYINTKPVLIDLKNQGFLVYETHHDKKVYWDDGWVTYFKNMDENIAKAHRAGVKDGQFRIEASKEYGNRFFFVGLIATIRLHVDENGIIFDSKGGVSQNHF